MIHAKSQPTQGTRHQRCSRTSSCPCVNPTKSFPLPRVWIYACASADLSGVGGPNPTRLKAVGAVPTSMVPAGSMAAWHVPWLPGEAGSASREGLPHRSPKLVTPVDNAGSDTGKGNKPSCLAFCCHSFPFSPTWEAVVKLLRWNKPLLGGENSLQKSSGHQEGLETAVSGVKASALPLLHHPIPQL